MAKITFLGTASSIPAKTRDNTSFLFTHKKHNLLVDCPGSISHKLLKIGVDFTKVKNIIITHEHIDHIYGLVSLIHTQGYLNLNPINIFSNPSSIKLIKKLVPLFRLNRKNYPKIRYINVFSKKHFFRKKDLSLEAIKNSHIKNSFGIKFSFAKGKSKGKLFYSSDTSFSPSMLEKAGDVDFLIHDCTASYAYFRKHPALYEMHTTSKTLNAYLSAKTKLKLIPIHFLLLEKDEEKRIKKELAGIRKRVIWPQDFKAINL